MSVRNFPERTPESPPGLGLLLRGIKNAEPMDAFPLAAGSGLFRKSVLQDQHDGEAEAGQQNPKNSVSWQH